MEVEAGRERGVEEGVDSDVTQDLKGLEIKRRIFAMAQLGNTRLFSLLIPKPGLVRCCVTILAAFQEKRFPSRTALLVSR